MPSTEATFQTLTGGGRPLGPRNSARIYRHCHHFCHQDSRPRSGVGSSGGPSCYPWIARANIMTIAAKYEDGVFKPLEEVKLTEGTRVEVHAAEQPRRRPKSAREFA